MKILFVTDLHGKFDYLATLPSCDLFLCGGDFTSFGTLDDFSAAVTAVEKYFPNFYGVLGNLDPQEGNQILAQRNHLLTADKILTVNGITICGFGGSNLCPVNTPNQWPDQDKKEELNIYLPQLQKQLNGKRADIIVTHAPSKGSEADVIPNGMHVGSEAVAHYIQQLQPRLHLSGHIHEATGIFTESTACQPPIQLANPGPQKAILIHWTSSNQELIQMEIL